MYPSLSLKIPITGLAKRGLSVSSLIVDEHGNPYDSSNSSHTQSTVGLGVKSVLTMATSSRHDSTVFFCEANNVFGSDVKRINLIVQGETNM